jgi:hypothetical protein
VDVLRSVATFLTFSRVVLVPATESVRTMHIALTA